MVAWSNSFPSCFYLLITNNPTFSFEATIYIWPHEWSGCDGLQPYSSTGLAPWNHLNAIHSLYSQIWSLQSLFFPWVSSLPVVSYFIHFSNTHLSVQLDISILFPSLALIMKGLLHSWMPLSSPAHWSQPPMPSEQTFCL